MAQENATPISDNIFDRSMALSIRLIISYRNNLNLSMFVTLSIRFNVYYLLKQAWESCISGILENLGLLQYQQSVTVFLLSHLYIYTFVTFK